MLTFFPRGVLDEILNLIKSVSEGFTSYSCIEETNKGPCRSKRHAFSLQSNLGYKYETYMFSLLPVHSISLNYDLDL